MLTNASFPTPFGFDLPYCLSVPDDAKPGMPLIVFLHGAGERGAGGEELSRVMNIGFGAMIREGLKLPAYVLMPQCPETCRWSDLTFPLHDLIVRVAAEIGADPDRVTVTGISMGGFGTWLLATAYPEMFAGIAPVCGGGNVWEAWKLTKMPVWAFHGDRDTVVPTCLSVDMADAINGYGGNARLTLLHGVDHGCWEEAYRDSRVVGWLLEQKRPAADGDNA